MPKDSTPALFADGELAEQPAKLLTDAVGLWNEFAARNKWKAVKILDSQRRTSLRRAIKDYGGLVGFRAGLEKVQRNRFVMGKVPPTEGRKQFIATLDWFIRTATVRKVLEDFYEDEGATPPGAPAAQRSVDDEWKLRLNNYQPGRWWHSAWGPRPEEAGCQCPPNLLAWWREVHKIEFRPAIKETREQRISQAIVSLRKIGKWDRANKAEEELARLENRAPVLVPSPDVAHLDGDTVESPKSKVGPMVFDSDTGARQSPADLERERRLAFKRANIPPEWDGIPEGDYEVEGDE